MNAMLDFYLSSNAWPFEEARKVKARIEKLGKTSPVIFETGYGPSGLPHIGTFGEVARTTMVRHAFTKISDHPTQLICFSDDMDGLRKVPTNIPNQEAMAAHLNKPLTSVPDPFGTHSSFGAHNNARLQAFLDQFGFEYEFKSATACYQAGEFDETLRHVLRNYDKVMQIMLPSLREERAASYSPFMPLCPKTGHVLQVPIESVNADKGTLTYKDPTTGELIETPVTGGRCKLQWKPDWAMRWAAMGVDYEMCGKDLIDSVKLSGQICRAIGGTAPENLTYELFLDEGGQKISKSKGNGLTIEEWLTYASNESLALYMFKEPKRAKRLHFDVIPKHVDEYSQFSAAFARQTEKEQIANPVWHIHNGNPPVVDTPINFSMLLNLVSASNAENADVLWGFIKQYAPHVTPETHPQLNAQVGFAIKYFHDFVAPTKKFRAPTEQERTAMQDLYERLLAIGSSNDADALQTMVFDVGKTHEFTELKLWFQALYQVLLGQDQGPRFGSFIALYGVEKTMAMIFAALNRAE